MRSLFLPAPCPPPIEGGGDAAVRQLAGVFAQISGLFSRQRVGGRLPQAPPGENPGWPVSGPLTLCSANYYHLPVMLKALPEHIHPLRLAHHGESLVGSVVPEQMPRLAKMLHEKAGGVEFELRFGHDDGGQACVLGRIDAKLIVLCQRCLEPMDIDVEREVRLALVRGDAEAAALDGTYDPLLVGDQPVLLSDLLENELILAMPNFSRHPRAECEVPPGADAVDHPDKSGEGHEGQNVDTAGEFGEDNPFSVLESLKPRKTP